jgi:hypothetical protein
MCGTSASADRLLVVHEARVAADELVERFLRLPVAKAMNLGTRAGFDRAVALLAAQLRRATGRADVDAVREAIGVLDVDWARTTAAERRRLVAEAMAAAGRATAIVPARIEAPFNDAAQEVVAATRTDARRSQRLAIGAEFNAIDRRVIAHVTSSQGNFVRDEYGRRIEGFGEEARRIVATGLEEGLGRDDIAQALEQAARAGTRRPRPVLLGDGRRLVHRAGPLLRADEQLRRGGHPAVPHRGGARRADHEHLPLPARQDLLGG